MKEIELLKECLLQLRYLNEKFGQTGTTNTLISKIHRYLDEKGEDVFTQSFLTDKNKSK